MCSLCSVCECVRVPCTCVVNVHACLCACCWQLLQWSVTKQLAVAALTLVLVYHGVAFVWEQQYHLEYADEPNVASQFHNRIPAGYKAMSIANRNDHMKNDRPHRDVCTFVPSPVTWTRRRMYVVRWLSSYARALALLAHYCCELVVARTVRTRTCSRL